MSEENKTKRVVIWPDGDIDQVIKEKEEWLYNYEKIFTLRSEEGLYRISLKTLKNIGGKIFTTFEIIEKLGLACRIPDANLKQDNKTLTLYEIFFYKAKKEVLMISVFDRTMEGAMAKHKENIKEWGLEYDSVLIKRFEPQVLNFV